jgi:hypothetical protein
MKHPSASEAWARGLAQGDQPLHQSDRPGANLSKDQEILRLP